MEVTHCSSTDGTRAASRSDRVASLQAFSTRGTGCIHGYSHHAEREIPRNVGQPLGPANPYRLANFA